MSGAIKGVISEARYSTIRQKKRSSFGLGGGHQKVEDPPYRQMLSKLPLFVGDFFP